MTRYDEELGRRVHDALADRAGEVQGHPLSLPDVKRRATRIRRRRQALAGVVAASVVAVAVPAGLSVTDTLDRSVRPGPAETPSATPRPAPERPVHVLLTTEVDEQGEEPAVPYLYDGAIRVPGGATVAVEGDLDGVAPLGEHWVVTGSDEEADRFAAVLGPDGSVAASMPLADGSGVALSDDGMLAAYGLPDGRVIIRTANGDVVALETGEVQHPQVVAVTGSPEECLDPSVAAGPPCRVYFNEGGEVAQGWFVDADGTVDRLGLHMVSDATDDLLVGYSSFEEDGSVCSSLEREGTSAWETCDYALGRLSPDGSHVLASPSYQSGSGPGAVTILDARTGDVVAEYVNDITTHAFINRAVWESESTVVATVFEKGGWSLMRMGVDGSLEKVMDLEGGDGVRPPLFLPAG